MPFSGNAGLTPFKRAHELSPKQGLVFAAIFEFLISKRVQVGNPLCDHEMGFISMRIITEAGVTRSWTTGHIDHISILATELKPAGCRSYAMKRPNGIQNENITRMSL